MTEQRTLPEEVEILADETARFHKWEDSAAQKHIQEMQHALDAQSALP